MRSYPSLSRILASGSGLSGLGYMMAHPDPTVESVLVGLSCLIACVVFSAVPDPRKPVRRRASVPSPLPRLETEPQAIQLLSGPQPHRLLMAKVVAQQPSKLPVVPTHRQRINDRQPPRKR